MKETPHERKRAQAFMRGSISSCEYDAESRHRPSKKNLPRKSYTPTPHQTKKEKPKQPEDHITKSDFLLEFFGSFNRDFGSPERFFVDNPTEITDFINTCAQNRKPAFVSVQPMRAKAQPLGIEKVFFDFDYCKKSETLTDYEAKKRKSELNSEVKHLLQYLESLNIKPLVIQTRRGYHIHVFFDSVYEINNETEFWKLVYKQLQTELLGRRNYLFLDSAVIGDVNRMCRIPLSIHEKTGQECILVDNQLQEDKIRSIQFFKRYGLKQRDLMSAMDKARANEKAIKRKHAQYKPRTQIFSSTSGLRPCFTKALDEGEMCHQQRLALL